MKWRSMSDKVEIGENKKMREAKYDVIYASGLDEIKKKGYDIICEGK